MIITKQNTHDIQNIRVHDSILKSFIYNPQTNSISLKLLSTWEEDPSLNITIKDIAFLQFQNADLWGKHNIVEINEFYFDEQEPQLNLLISEFKEQNNNSKIPEKLNKDYMFEIVFTLFNGGEIRIICQQINIQTKN